MAKTLQKSSWLKAKNLSTSGILPQNAFLNNMFDKVGTQVVYDGFTYTNPLLQAYQKTSNLFGGVDEIISVGLSGIREWDPEKYDWTKEKYVIEQFKIWAEIEYEDVYVYSLGYDQIQRAFLNEANYDTTLALFAKSVEDQKQTTWYKRIKDIHKKYPIVIEIDLAENTDNLPQAEFIGMKITEVMKLMTQPTTQFNIAGKTNATPLEAQQLTWNIPFKNSLEWTSAKFFSQGNIEQFANIMKANILDYQDNSIIAVLDTAFTVYLGLKFAAAGMQDFFVDKRTNHYRHETTTVAIVPFQNGIVFRLKDAKGGEKAELSTVINDQVIYEIEEITPESLLEAVKEQNSELTNTDNLGVVFNNIVLGEGTANINSLPLNKLFTNKVTVSFKVGTLKKK